MSQGEKKEFVPPPEAKQDADGFWIMPDKSFYDPDGYFFNAEGKDQFGGYYNEEGEYIPPKQEEEVDQEEQEKHPEKEEKQVPHGYAKHSNFIPKVEGAHFNEAGFYILPNDGGFYDPLGNYFDKNGYDLTGGYYDDEGNYKPGDALVMEDQDDQVEQKDNEDEDIKEQDYAYQKYPHDPENVELEAEEAVLAQTEEQVAIEEKKVDMDEDEEEEGVIVTKVSAK